MIKFSVITTVYNQSKFIRDCIESVLSQSYKNFEYVIVDDGSSDDSYQLCKEYADKDERIKLIHKENGGVSSARNKGIENVTGDYVLFLDGDDFFDKRLLQVCYDHIKDNEDLVVYGYNYCDKNGKYIKNEVFADKNTILCTAEDYMEYIKKDFFRGAGILKCCKTSIIKDNIILFDTSIRYCEDSFFWLMTLFFTKKIVNISFAGYNYRNDQKSCTAEIKKPEKAKSLLTVCVKLYEFLVEKNINQMLSKYNEIAVNVLKLGYIFGPMGFDWKINKEVIDSLTIGKNDLMNKWCKEYFTSKTKRRLTTIEEKYVFYRDKYLLTYLANQNKFALKCGLLKLKIMLLLVKVKIKLKKH